MINLKYNGGQDCCLRPFQEIALSSNAYAYPINHPTIGYTDPVRQ
jgi:hypothetical protein